MMIRNAWLPCIVLLTIPSLLLAQSNRERKVVRAKGALQAVAAGAFQVVNEDGEQWVIKVDPRSKYNVFQGSADVKFLRRGMLVEFRNTFDKKGKAQSEVRSLKVFSPREDTRLGVIPVPGGTAGGLFSSSDEDENKKKKTAKPAARPFIVAGPIRAIKDNKMTVAVGRDGALVHVELADKVQIAFNFADFRYARQGDTVEFFGWANPEQSDLVMASRLTITAAKPLGGEYEKSQKKATKVPDLNSLDDF